MTAREQQRAMVLARILHGELTMPDGASLLGLSERQLWRLRATFGASGPAGLVHGNRDGPRAGGSSPTSGRGSSRSGRRTARSTTGTSPSSSPSAS